MAKRLSTLFQYRILIILLGPLLLAYTLYMALRYKDKAYLRQRLGFYDHTRDDRPLWFHAASVGEVNTVLALIEAIHERHPERALILTTGTPTGGKIARHKLPEKIRQYYLPLDCVWSVRRFIKALHPSCAVIMETELWPNLYCCCARNEIPVTIINGRISNKTLQTNAWMYRLYTETLERVSAILARSEHDKTGFVTIGATPSLIKVIGNLKFAPDRQAQEPVAPLLTRPYVLLASSRDEEELPILKAWQSIDHGDYLLVIAPRHPQRSKSLQRQLRKQVSHLAVRSRNQPVMDETEVYLADTLGELNAFIAHARLVIMGGSFVPKGGHNLIEVGRHGKTTLVGPHMENFADETRLFVEHSAAIQVNDVTALAERLQSLLFDDAALDKYGTNALSLIEQETEVVERYVEAITPYCLAKKV